MTNFLEPFDKLNCFRDIISVILFSIGKYFILQKAKHCFFGLLILHDMFALLHVQKKVQVMITKVTFILTVDRCNINVMK